MEALAERKIAGYEIPIVEVVLVCLKDIGGEFGGKSVRDEGVMKR